MNTTPEKTQQQWANEFFDKRMKKESYKGKNGIAIRTMFGKALLKYSVNSYKFSPAYLRELLGKKTYTMYDIGCMMNIIRGAALEMIGCVNEEQALSAFDMLDAEYREFDSIAGNCWKAADKEAASKIKAAPKMQVAKN